MRAIAGFLMLVFLAQCSPKDPIEGSSDLENSYLDYSNRKDKLSGGSRLIPIQTGAGEFKVWTKRVGNNPDIKVLLLHGGPGATHEYLECFDSYFPQAGIEYYYHDQLGSFFSDQPDDSSLWNIEQFVENLEQVRKALGLNADNFYLFGHSWGGILALEYALKYQQNLKGMIIANMMASIPDYNQYSREVLSPELDPEVLAKIREYEEAGDFTNQDFLELVHTHYYPRHVLRMPLEEWPDPVNRAFAHINYDLYLAMQGPSEMGIVGNAILKDWDIKSRLSEITVPTLTIGGTYDTMDPDHMEWMAEEMPNGQYLLCENGSHMAMYDDQVKFFEGLIEFVREVEEGG